MDIFPAIVRGPSRTFSAEPSGKAVLVGNVASGYPVLNVLSTFEPDTFTVELRSVPNANKLTVMGFYRTHKGVPFYWWNNQDDTTHEVCFAQAPRCRMDGRKDLWRIQITFLQTAPSV